MAVQLLMDALATTQGKDLTNLDSECMWVALEQMLRGLDGTQNETELRQLSRQGVGRFMGALSTCRLFGIVESDDFEESQEMDWETALTLGLQRGHYRLTGDKSQIESFWKHASSQAAFCTELGAVDTPNDLLSVARAVKNMLMALGQEVASLQTKSGG